MNQYSILKDVLTNKAYGLAVKSIDGFEFMGFNEQSCKWANLANQKQLDISQLPDGIIAEDLQDVTEDIAAQFNLKIKAPLALVKHKEKLNNFNFKESERFDTGSTTPSITDMPLGEFEKEVRDMVLEFKAKSFKKNIVQSEIALKSRFNQLAFNPSTNRFQPRPNSNFKQIEADELRTKASNGMQRRFGKEITEQINSTIETKWPGEFITGFLLGRRRGRKKRKKMSFKTMEILDFHEKGIGRAIGRAATPNVGRSRRIGMRASREITGQLDPSKRRDVDGDGMIFDGTWREIPDPTRFKPNESQTNFRNPYGQGRMREIVEREKLQSETARIFEEAKRKPRSERSTRGVSSRVYRPGQDTGAETYIDDIPDMSDDDLRKEIERLENARYPYDGNVTKPRMDKERIEEMRRELQRRSRGGGRKPIKKPSRALDNPSTEGLEAARLFLENIKKNRRNLTESEREALVNERTPLRGLSSQSDGGRQEIERLVVSEGYPSKAKRKKMFVSKEDVDSFIEDLKLEYRKRRRQIESEIDSDGYYMDDEELIQRFMDDYNMSRGEARQAMRDYRRNWDLLEKEDERHQNRLTELEEERAKLPYQQEIDDPIKLGPNGFPEREDQMERYEELMKEEAEPVFRVRKKPEAGGKRENVGERSARGVSSRTASRDSVSDEEGRIGSVRQAAQRASENRRNRGTRPLPVAMTPNARRAMANTQRASSPRGLQSRSGVQKQSKGIPGVDKIGPSDGAQWEALTPDQKTTATTALDKELDRVTGELKKRFAGYWRGQVRGAKKQGIRGGRYTPRDTTEYLTTSDITEMQRQLDSNTSAKPEIRAAVQKQIDAVRLLTTMKSKKDYSMLEQLHPAQKAKVLDALKKTDDFKPLKGFTRTSESTAFKGGAGLSKEDLLTSLTPDISLDDKKKDKKNISFRNRILRANPERQRRRELRRQRRTGAIGRTGISLDPELQLKKRKLRAAAFKRQILSKFRKTKDAEQLADSLGDRKAELHPVQIDANGNIKLAPNFVETMDSLDKRLLEGKKDGDKVYDVLLRDLWENFGYSEVPALVTEEEVKSLLAAGWQPIVRGTGNEEVMSESYVEQFLTSEGRFIAGQGGRAYGVGEYFAYPGGNWSGYSGTADSRHTMLALIPPTATIMTRQELSNEQREMNRLTTAINDEFRIAGDRETVSVLSAQELAQMIRKASPQLANSKTRSGQILNQLTLRLEELDNMPGDTSQERKRILNTFDLLERMSKKESGHFAPMIGVDAIDTNDGDGSKDPVLLHNRSIVAAFQTPMTRKQAEEMSAGVKKVWTKFKSRNKVVSAEQSPDSDSTATRRVKPRLIRRARSNTPQQQTQQSAQPQSQAKKSSGVVDTSSWKTGTPQNVGSNPAKLLTAPDGTQYYAKLPKPNENVQQATERMETEVLASELYKLAGVPTVDLMMGDENGTPQMLSKMIQSRGPNSQSDQDSARAGFVVDAWLANWDAPLNDNIKFDSQNRPVRIDVGGSLDYRAQGAKKDTTRTPFGDTVGEILSMQKRGTFNFANMDPAEIKKQAQAMSSVTDASIRATVSKIVGDPQRAAKLAQTLINRRNDIVTRYG